MITSDPNSLEDTAIKLQSIVRTYKCVKMKKSGSKKKKKKYR